MPSLPAVEQEDTPEVIDPSAVFDSYSSAIEKFPDNKEFLEKQLENFKKPLTALSRIYDNLGEYLRKEGHEGLGSVSDILKLDPKGPHARLRSLALSATGEVWKQGIPVFGVNTWTSETETVSALIKHFREKLLPDQKITAGKREGTIGGIKATFGRYGGGARIVLHPDPFQQVQLVNELMAPNKNPFENNIATVLKGLAEHGTINDHSQQKAEKFFENAKVT